MAQINEYPQAVSINNNDLFVIDQESGGDHATKSASVSQIADKATSGVQSQIGSLSTLTTTDKSSIVGAVNSQGVASSITPTSTKGTFSACYQSVVGDMVTVQGVFACNSNISAGGGVAFTLPYGLKTGTNASNFLMYDISASVNIHVRISNNGDVTPVDSMTNHSYRFTFTYIK